MKKTRMSLRVLAGVLSVALIAASGVTTFAADGPPADEVPAIVLQDAYEVYQTDSYDFTDETSKQALLSEAESFPTAYDMRDKNLVTPVKLQNPFGSCWAFAAIAAAETSLISKGLLKLDEADLSERHLSYFAYTPIKDEDSDQYGEGYIDEGMTGSAKLGSGGNPLLASSVFASGAGPVLEKNDKDLIYKGLRGSIEQRTTKDGKLIDFCYSANDKWDVPYEKRNRASFELLESYLLPSPAKVKKDKYEYNEAGTAAIKKQLLAGRAVQIGFLADRSSPGDDDVEPILMSDDWAQYGAYVNTANHAVTIVGWDDTIGSENSAVQFKESSNPIKDGFGPGAWLVKNSWGSGEEEFPNRGDGTWGIRNEKGEGTGYFWLSYYDHSISDVEAIDFQEVKDYWMEAYDFLPPFEMHSTEFDEEVKMANLFNASDNEIVKQISFYTTHPNTTVTYEVYLMVQDVATPTLGKLVEKGECGPYEFGGFHRVDLKTPLTLMDGQSFSVVIKERTSDGKYAVVLPIASAGSSKGIVNAGESEIYKDEVWNDLESYDVKEELLSNLPPDYPEMTYDNFPIKAYAEPIHDLFYYASLSGTTSLYFTPENSKSTLKIRANKYAGVPLPDNLKVKWEQDDYIYDIMGNPIEKGQLLDISGLDEEGCGMKAVISVRKEGDKCIEGNTYVYAHLIDGDNGRDLGTIVAHVSAERLSIDGVALKDPDAKNVYTGSKIEPEFVVLDFQGNEMRPGIDFTYEYLNNVKCGVATISVMAAGDYEKYEEPACDFFAILPQKAVLNKVTAGAGSLTLNVKDQSKTGITGYQVQYREKGASKWSKKNIKSSSGKLTLNGLKAGKQYEVKVCGWLHVPNVDDYYGQIDKNNYGEESKVLTSGVIAPAKAVVKKLTAGKQQLTVTMKDQKSTGITGYEIQYRAKGAAKWSKKTLSASKTQLTIKNLKSGTQYQVRARGYVKSSGKTSYGPFSDVKTSAVIQ